jgi:hypothetical protein
MFKLSHYNKRLILTASRYRLIQVQGPRARTQYWAPRSSVRPHFGKCISLWLIPLLKLS